VSSTPNVPQSQGEGSEPIETASTPRWILVAFLIVLAGLGYLGYASYAVRQDLRAAVDRLEQRSALLDAQLAQANDRVAELRGQLDVTSEKLGLTQQELARARALAQTIRKEQRTADEQLLSQLTQTRQQTQEKLGELSGQLSGTQSEVEATKQQLNATIGKLERAVGDLGIQSGLIARNREELEELKRLGERNYFEFDIRKSTQPEQIGPIRVRLKKVDTKRYRYTLDVYAGDKAIEKKDKTLYEPVQFYLQQGARWPYEIVVFELSKDRIAGYLSTPKAGAATSGL
jgi:chromosome segregation ATPase